MMNEKYKKIPDEITEWNFKLILDDQLNTTNNELQELLNEDRGSLLEKKELLDD